MTNRIPLVVDIEDGNKIKELPAGDNLNLEGSALINATSVSTTGALTAASINVGGTALSALATTANYDDLNNTPILFTGDYNDLQNKPFIPLRSNDLQNVSSIAPANGEALIWNSVNNQWEPNSIVSAFDAVTNLQDLQNVIISGAVDNKYLKYYSGAWRAANVTYAEVQNTPTNVSQFVNDAGYITSETDSQSLSLVGSNLTISNGNTVDLAIPTLTSQLTNDAGFLTAETDSQELNLIGTELNISGGNTIDLQPLLDPLDGDFLGSVFADDSTLMIDGTNAKIVGKFEGPQGTIKAEIETIGTNGDVASLDVLTSQLYNVTDEGNPTVQLPNGLVGQMKIFIMMADNPSGIDVAPSNLFGGNAIPFLTAGQHIMLIYTTDGWAKVGGNVSPSSA
jgi:hypothetical protein|tara:strand:+ start:9454 stop:10641 length:1188 start_codon:yes stop_codon:yes gene_type:complete